MSKTKNSHSENQELFGWGEGGFTPDLKRVETLKRFAGTDLNKSEEIKQYRLLSSDISISPSRLPQDLKVEFECSLGQTNCAVSHDNRVRHCLGKSYRDLIRLRSKQIQSAPDVVLYPESIEHIEEILHICNRHRIAVVPFGGGTSVVGGVESVGGDKRYLASLDIGRLNRVLNLDDISQTITVEAGIRGPELEGYLNERGYTLGHFPQSYEFSTVGGWICARSSGQNSVRYGSISKLLISVVMVTPQGTIVTPTVPSMACGPDLNELLLGSEGCFGIVYSCTLRISRVPEHKDYFTYLFPSFEQAAEAAREILQESISVAMIRISDEVETQAFMKMAGLDLDRDRGWKPRLARSFFKIRGIDMEKASVAIIGLEGRQTRIRAQKREVVRVLAQHAGVSIGTRPGRKWLQDRFSLPYLRDLLIDNGLLIETLETATVWSNLIPLYRATRQAIESCASRQGYEVRLMTHISHLYSDGASLYFTLLAPKNPADPLQQWQQLKHEASCCILEKGGIISHHHGIGLDHKEYLTQSRYDLQVWDAVKNHLDPHGIMNPGKLLW